MAASQEIKAVTVLIKTFYRSEFFFFYPENFWPKSYVDVNFIFWGTPFPKIFLPFQNQIWNFGTLFPKIFLSLSNHQIWKVEILPSRNQIQGTGLLQNWRLHQYKLISVTLYENWNYTVRSKELRGVKYSPYLSYAQWGIPCPLIVHKLNTEKYLCCYIPLKA